jgi:outer membrane lipoprotein SlyB
MNKRNYSILLPAIVLASVIFSGCAASKQSRVYTRAQAQTALNVYTGTVLKVSDVTIEGRQTGAGAVAGAVMGGIAGSAIGGGVGRRAATAGGVLGGAAAGTALEKRVTTEAAQEIEVELDDGRLIAIVQGKDDRFAVGDRVRVYYANDGTWRVRQ